jgi:uncharacterized protein (TIGR00369 family)
MSLGGAFTMNNGPLYGRWTGERVQVGFRVEERHTNPYKNCHGGMLATFADMLLPCAAHYQTLTERRFLPTISLNIDYLGPAAMGAWVQGEADVLRQTRNLMFAQGLVTADGQPALRVNGIFKLGVLMGDGSDMDPFKIKA